MIRKLFGKRDTLPIFPLGTVTLQDIMLDTRAKVNVMTLINARSRSPTA